MAQSEFVKRKINHSSLCLWANDFLWIKKGKLRLNIGLFRKEVAGCFYGEK